MRANSFSRNGQGFTLIEMIAGIVIMAIAMTALTGVLFPQATRSVDPVYQVRAAELGQSLINEIMGKAFDENTDYNSGLRCGEAGADPCTAEDQLGPDDEDVDEYDDVDDYHEYDQSKAQLDGSDNYDELYLNFTFEVEVTYDDDLDGDHDDDDSILIFKRVEVKVTTPGGQDFKFVEYKGNY